MINIKKVCMYIILFVLLFQESIQRIVPVNAIDMFDELIVLFFTVVAFINVIKNRTLNKTVLILIILFICFFAVGTVSLYINSSHTFSQYIASAFLATKCFLLIIDICIIGFNEDTKTMFIKAINFIGILCVIVGILNFIFPNLYMKIFKFGILTYRFGFVSVTSLFYHPGRFGWFMLFLSIMNYTLYKKSGASKNKKLFILFAICSLFSFRTKVIISIIILLLFNLIISKKIEAKKIIFTIFFGLVIFLSFNKVIMNTYYLYFDDSNTNISARQSLTDNSYKIVKDFFPLGVGFGKYGSWYARKYYSEYYYRYNMSFIYGLNPEDPFFATDVFWGSILGETGFLGTIFYILFLFYIYINLKHNLKKYNFSEIVGIYFGFLVFIQSVVESFGEQSFNSPPQYIFLGFIVGTALNESINLSKRGEN